MVLRILMILTLGGPGCRTAPTPSPQEAELAFLQQSLERLYGPLLFLVEESELAVDDVLFQLKRDRLPPENGEGSEAALAFGLYRAENDLLPRNEEMLRVIQAHGRLAEIGPLGSLLDELREHQASWRTLHRRWKEEKVAYPVQAWMSLPEALGRTLRSEFGRLRQRQAVLFKSIPGAELDFVERQLAELYAPLVRQNREGYLAFFGLLGDLRRGSIFPLNPARQSEELARWLLWCDEVFFPRNEETRAIIQSGYFLVEGAGKPEGMLAFLDHWNSWKLEHARWVKHQVPYRWHSKRPYPRAQFSDAADAIFQSLKLKQLSLRGEARALSGPASR